MKLLWKYIISYYTVKFHTFKLVDNIYLEKSVVTKHNKFIYDIYYYKCDIKQIITYLLDIYPCQTAVHNPVFYKLSPTEKIHLWRNKKCDIS